MAKPVQVQRTENAMAIQAIAEDEESMAIVRGWLGAPIDADLAQLTDNQIWLVRSSSDDSKIYLVPPEAFRTDFTVVLEVVGG